MMVNVDAVPNVYFFLFSSYIEFLSFPWIFSSMSLEIFDFILCLFVTCMKKNLKRSPQRLSALTVPRSHAGCVFAPGLTRHHPACFKSVKWNFSQHKWGEMMQNSNPFKDGMFQKPRTKHPMNYDEDIDSWKMVKIPRLQVGSKKIWY